MMQPGNIRLAHGSGGQAMADLIREIFIGVINDPELRRLEDQARLMPVKGRLAMTTDGYVIDPIFFPGGDIGRLAVCGTVNDLVVGGARPLYLSCAFILEEGWSLDDLHRIVKSMKAAADEAGVRIVTGDTKVVPKGMADKVFITTTGVGEIPVGLDLGAVHIRPGDKILISGYLGDHGAAVLDARGELALQHTLESDCRPVGGLVTDVLSACPTGVRTLRDPTRGGLAAVLNEFAQVCGFGLRIHESALPVREAVRGMCEILGLDPLYLANEGKIVAVVAEEAADQVLDAMHAHPDGCDAAVIGEVTETPTATVILHTVFGGERIVDLPVGEQLPRIC